MNFGPWDRGLALSPETQLTTTGSHVLLAWVADTWTQRWPPGSDQEWPTLPWINVKENSQTLTEAEELEWLCPFSPVMPSGNVQMAQLALVHRDIFQRSYVQKKLEELRDNSHLEATPDIKNWGLSIVKFKCDKKLDSGVAGANGLCPTPKHTVGRLPLEDSKPKHQEMSLTGAALQHWLINCRFPVENTAIPLHSYVICTGRNIPGEVNNGIARIIWTFGQRLNKFHNKSHLQKPEFFHEGKTGSSWGKTPTDNRTFILST